MSSQNSVLFALSEREIQLFFSPPARKLISQLVPHARWIQPRTKGEDWDGLLKAEAPRIIVSGWETERIPEGLPNLAYICHVAGSVRGHVPRALLESGVLVTNWGGLLSETVAEAALMMILSALRRSHFFADIMHRQRGWSTEPAGSSSLFDRKVGIHGFGAIARNLVPLLRPFRNPIKVFAPKLPESAYTDAGVEPAQSLEELFSWADIVVEAEALTPLNHGIVTEELLRKIRPDGVFVNIARGKLVDQGALGRLAAEGRIRVALDVFEVEPLPADSALRGQANVVLFPHLAGIPVDRTHLCGDLCVENIRCFLAGGSPRHQVTLEIYDRST